EVVVGFLHDDPRLAVVLGMLHSSAKAAPIEPSDDNHQKAFVSRSGVELLLDDEAVSVKLSTPGGASLLIDDDQGLIELVDQNGNSVTLSGDGVRIESASALDLVGVDVKVEASAGLEGSAGAELKLDGGAGAELTSSAVTTIKGSLVKIN
ncbi:MAG: Rhs element Vgr protein, partial [Alphaproteobacteria bacterium]|nr:Rhs element Vgr protein [Alphaproteobacteria bacterium]